MQICPVCFWEDAMGEFPYNGSNELPLPLAQQNYQRMGACELEYADLTRPPRQDEARPEDWVSFETLRLKIIDQIEDVFGEVTLEDGVTLHQSREFDCLGYPSQSELAKAASLDPETRWKEIIQDKISSFSESMIFFDPKGFRFHLPAFMRHALRMVPSDSGGHADGVMFALLDGPDKSYSRGGIEILTLKQKQCVASFLHFFATSDGDFYQSNARKALKNGWIQWLPETFRSS